MKGGGILKKRKTYEISIIDKTYSKTISDETKFFTSDTALELGFELKETEYTFESAEIVLLNIDDRSLVTRPVTKSLDSFTYELDDDITAHYGEWRGQIRFEQAGETYVSSPVKFRIENDLSNERPPQLSDVQSWVSLKRYADSLTEELKQAVLSVDELEVTFNANELERQTTFETNESERTETFNTNETTRQENESVRIEAEKQREGTVAEIENRQTSVENQFNAIQQDLTDKDVISAPEIIAARNGEANLKTRLDKEQQEVTAQLAQTATELVKKAEQIDLEVERQRISNLIAVENSVDNAETADIRVGADAKIYDSAGDAVRSQISRLDQRDSLVLENKHPNADYDNDAGIFAASANFSVAANEVTFQATSRTGGIFTNLVPKLPYNANVYFKVEMDSSSPNARVGFTTPYVHHSGSGEYETISGITKLPSSGNIRFYYTDISTENFTSIKVKKAVVLNLDEIFGDKMPSKEQMDSLVKQFPDNFFKGSVKPDTTKLFNFMLSEISKPSESKSLEGLKWVSFGDSITFANLWQPSIADELGLIHTNRGIGSTTLAGQSANAFWNTSRLDSVKSANPDIVTILGGANDLALNVVLGTEADITTNDTNTFYGAYSFIISNLLAWKPSLRIIILGTSWGHLNGTRLWAENGGTVTTGLTYTDFSDASKAIAKYYGLPFVDLHGEMGLNSITRPLLLSDWIHPNTEGAKRISALVREKMIRFAHEK